MLLAKKYNKKPISLTMVKRMKQECKQFDKGLTLPFTAQKQEAWYYYPSIHTETIYSNLGNSVLREEFDAKIDSGEAVMTGRDYIAFYPTDKTKYHVGIFVERRATDIELQKHLSDLQRRLKSVVTSHHYLTGQPKHYREYLEKRIAAVKVAYSNLVKQQRKAA